MIRALCIADRTPVGGLRSWMEKIDMPDMVITLGDLDYFMLKDLDLWPRWTYNNGAPLRIGVYGNHCGEYLEDVGILDMHNKRMAYKGISWRGIEGGPKYKNHPHHYTDDEIRQVLNGFEMTDPGEIILSHTPPRGANDNQDEVHRGWPSLREHCLKYKPRLVLHGHTYPDQRETMVGETLVHYVNGISYLEITDTGVNILATDCDHI